MIENLVKTTRSVRRFVEGTPVCQRTLLELVDLARLSASGANLQPLKYFLSCDIDTNEKIFPSLKWAGYLGNWSGPSEGERPAAYIVILCDTDIGSNCGCDAGIAMQSVRLGATEKGLASCIIASIDRTELAEKLDIDPKLHILFVVAIGEAKERIAIEETDNEGDIKYWRDDDGVHHVPKYPLGKIVIT